MKTPESLVAAVDCGIIQEVLRPLMSGKEAQIYLVVVDGSECVAKVYKEASQRTFKHRAAYTEGRRTRNSRDQRAISRRSRHGRTQDESGWRATEVDMIYRLRDAGVRVPAPIHFVDGVFVMELVKDAEGNPAPRLGDLRFEASEAREIYQQLLREVSRMLCAGVIHGDLSDFNVLMGADGPVLIDFPQSLEAARNQNARKFLLRDVENLHRFVERHSPGQPTRAYGQEMWSLYEANRLEPESELRGDYRAPEHAAATEEVLALIEDADREEHARREARGEAPPREAPRPFRSVVEFRKEARPRPGAGKRAGSPRAEAPPSRTAGKPASAKAPALASKASDVAGDAEPRRRRSRRGRRRRRSTAVGAGGDVGTTAPGSRPDTPTTETKALGPGEADGSKRRRRRRRASTRTGSGEARAGAYAQVERPAKPDSDPRGSRSPAPAAGAHRPRRRRRRRPGSSGSHEPSGG
jgi:RIO kinase 1